MNIGYKSDLGQLRENNEDAFLVDNKLGLFIVADGMGGHQGGEVASEMAVNIISSNIKEAIKYDDVHKIIKKSFAEANNKIYNVAMQDVNLNGMGTTIAIALYHKNKIYIAHIGDSRAYLIRDDEIKRLTQDHSIVAELIKAGEITEEGARKHRLRHVVTKVLGSEEPPGPDIICTSPQSEDYLLLCTDGLTDMLTDEEIKDMILNGSDSQKICEDLIYSANQNGGKDNITVILLRFD